MDSYNTGLIWITTNGIRIYFMGLIWINDTDTTWIWDSNGMGQSMGIPLSGDISLTSNVTGRWEIHLTKWRLIAGNISMWQTQIIEKLHISGGLILPTHFWWYQGWFRIGLPHEPWWATWKKTIKMLLQLLWLSLGDLIHQNCGWRSKIVMLNDI